MSQELNKAKFIFSEALQCEDSEERATYLDEACGNDQVLRDKVEGLLQAHDKAGGFLLEPVFGPEQGVSMVSEGPGTEIGPYKLLERIGEGGFGVVYMAQQRKPLKRQVALKIIKLGMDTKQVIARFEAERQALAMMDHPNIAKVLDAGATESGRPFFVMEIVKGIPLTEYCDQERLSTRDRLDLFVPVCNAIQHAHQKGIIHRDIKPSNILVTLHDGVPVPKVIDFGIAKATQQELTEKTQFTQFRQMIGTPTYMSPEQAEMSGLDVDTRTDIYSLGVLLYELLTGCTPFDTQELLRSGLDAMLKIIRERDPVKPSTRLTETGSTSRRPFQNQKSKIANDLDWIVMKALEKDRTRRYDTAKGFANDIQRFLNQEPVEAAAPSVGYRARKFIARHRTWVTSAALIACVLIISTVVSLHQALRATAAGRQVAMALAEAQAAERRANQEALLARRNLYAGDIHLAHQALQNSNFRRVRELLKRHIPPTNARAVTEDLRGWEWRYLWNQLSAGHPKVFATLPGPVFGLDLSPDGHHIAASTLTGMVELWEFPSGGQAVTLERGVGLPAKPVFFRDSFRLVYNCASGEEPLHNSALRIWDLRSQQISGEIFYPRGIGPKAVHPDGRRILFGIPPESIIKLWDSHSGIAPWKVPFIVSPVGGDLLLQRGDTFQFSIPDGREWFLGERNGDISVFDVGTGERIRRWSAHSDGITALRISPDGSLLASAGGVSENTIKLWNRGTTELVCQLDGHQSWVSDLDFTADGRQLVSSSGDQTVRLWDVNATSELVVFRGHQQEVWEVEVSPEGQTIIAGAKDGSIYVWDATRRTPDESPLIASEIRLFVLSCSGDRMAVLSEDRSVKIGALQNKTTLQTATYAGTDNSVVELSGDGRQLIVGKTDGVISVFEIATGTLLHSKQAHRAAITRVRMLADGDLVLSSDRERNILLQRIGGSSEAVLWHAVLDDVETAGQLQLFQGLAISPDERTLATGNYFGLVTLRELRTGRIIGTFQNPSPQPDILDLAFSPDGKTLTTADGHGVAGIWDVTTRRRLLALPRHRHAVRSLAYSSDGKRLVSGGGGDDAILIWDLATHQELLRLESNDQISQLAFSLDGSGLFALSGTGDLYAWRAPP